MKPTHPRFLPRLGVLLAGLALVASARLSARTNVEYRSGWDASYGFFRMVLDVYQNSAGGPLMLQGGRIEFKSLDQPYPITQAAGKKAAKPSPTMVVGAVVFAQANLGATATQFEGKLTGPFRAGTISVTGVNFAFRGRNYTNVAFRLTTPSTPAGGGSTGTTVGKTSGGGAASGASGTERLLFDNSNPGGVSNGPAANRHTDFEIVGRARITQIWTYHWNYGRGAAPGTIAIRSLGGTTYGPWRATASAGSGNAPNVNWTVYPNVTLPLGLYEVIDSSPATWSQNSESHGVGFAKIWGVRE